ncbi:MAG: PHP domain-containing protein [Chitinispirillaceae bacterium]
MSEKNNPASIRANTHIHSPYSFSSFDSIEQMARLGSEQNMDILGINDFNTCKGYDEFRSACAEKGIYPLFNIEFITRDTATLEAGKRWNSGSHPGAMYLCGKALNYPVRFCENTRNLLASLWKGTQDHIWKIIHRLNDHLEHCGLETEFDYNRIRSEYAKSTVRERHLARALYQELLARFPHEKTLEERFRTLFRDSSYSADVNDATSVQSDIIKRLFSPGCPAYVKKNGWEISFDQAKKIILEAGGIPCYPFLADDKAGFTEMEKDPHRLAHQLLDRGIHAVEFISPRTSFEVLKEYVSVFEEHHFCILFGTEHNTPEILPLLPAARDGVPFDSRLQETFSRGVCILAAHQELQSQSLTGFVNDTGEKLVEENQIDEFRKTGEEAIRKTKKTRNSLQL